MKELRRIADALERIATQLEKGGTTIQIQPVELLLDGKQLSKELLKFTMRNAQRITDFAGGSLVTGKKS